MYSKMALNNIKKSARQYSIYFLTLIFGVALFYSFNSIETQSLLLKLDEQGHTAFKLITQVMGIVSIFLSIVLAFLMIYANKYMMRHRSKEFSIYLTLGMSRKKLSHLLLIENMIIGLISLIIGLCIGFIMSEGLAVLTSYMFHLEFTHFKFVFSTEGCLKTIGLFMFVYIAMYIFNMLTVHRASIISLMKKDSQKERQIHWPLWVYAVLGIISIILFYIANSMAWDLNAHYLSMSKISQTIFLGIAAVFLFFFSATQLLMFIVQKLPRLYFKRLNPYVFRQIGSEMNTSFISLSITCIMIFLSICMLVGSFSFYATVQKGIKLATPFDGTIYYYGSRDINKDLQKQNIDLRDYVKANNTITLYNYSGIQYHDFLKDQDNGTLKKMYQFSHDMKVPMISISEYNRNQKLKHKKGIQLNQGNYLCVGNMSTYKQQMNLNHVITIHGTRLKGTGKYHEVTISDDNFPSNALTLVVPDSVIKYCDKSTDDVTRMNIIFKNKMAEKQMTAKLEKSKFEGHIITRTSVQVGNSTMSMMVSYLGLYIGMIFLMASTVVLSIQRLTKSEKDRNNYRILREIGARHHQCIQAIRKQILIFFGIPLFIALFESCFAFRFLKQMTELVGGIFSINIVLLSLMPVLIIYGFYFIMTYYNTKQNIKI